MAPITFIKTDSTNADFVHLVKFLDADLRFRDGEDHAFYAQFNKIDTIKHCIVAYENGIPVGCGAIKQYDSDTMEIKRMWVQPENRGNGIAAQIVATLENWTSGLGFRKCILETGIKQPEAIALYHKCNYKRISNYGQYEGVENSLCFEKLL